MAFGEENEIRAANETRFPDTHWAMVINAGDESEPALNDLCRLYWRPLFNYCCGAGKSVADAEDLTQGYFAELLAARSLRSANPMRGKFRTFLLSSFKNYITDIHRRDSAQKRGGDSVHLPFEINGSDTALLSIGPDESPDAAFDRQWASDVVLRARTSLRDECVTSGRGDWFDAVAGERRGVAFQILAERFGSTEDAIKSFSLRLKKRFRNLLEREIANTVASPDEIPGEMAYIAALLKI
jgi:RNA polymerase sigma-70 factor (ECF subfamily)